MRIVYLASAATRPNRHAILIPVDFSFFASFEEKT
jgi:hypothetical protein